MLEGLQGWLVNTDCRLILAFVSSSCAVEHLVFSFRSYAVVTVATFAVQIALVLNRAVVSFVLTHPLLSRKL